MYAPFIRKGMVQLDISLPPKTATMDEFFAIHSHCKTKLNNLENIRESAFWTKCGKQFTCSVHLDHVIVTT